MGKTIILIWGGAILLYLAATKSSGTAAVVNSLSSFVTGSTKALQGR